MKPPATAHTSHPWRIHELTADFRLEDVWALPRLGGADDFPRLVAMLAAGDPAHGHSPVARALWAIRWKLGELLRWDDAEAGGGPQRPTLRDRLPADLRAGPSGPDFASLPFRSLYLRDDEWAAEIANRTVHGVMHVAWVPDGQGRHRGQLAVYVRPNGLLGRAYLLAIRPFRQRLVYPPILARLEREWRARAGDRGAARVREVAVPPALRALSTLPGVDYEDAFVVEGGAARSWTGEQWARAAFEGAPSESRRKLRRGWLALGVKLDPGRSGSILGWELRHSDTELALLAAGSRIGMPAELLFKAERDGLLFATFARFENPIARAIWAAVAAKHRQVVPRLLERAAAREPAA